jgi:hypothetical protein
MTLLIVLVAEVRELIEQVEWCEDELDERRDRVRISGVEKWPTRDWNCCWLCMMALAGKVRLVRD